MNISSTFLLFAVSAAFTPGPNNIMIMSSGLNHGVRASMPHLMGVVLGVPAMFLALGFGLSYLFEVIPWLHPLVQIIGVFYLIYLAWLIAQSSPGSFNGKSSAKPLTFLQAVLFQWINPKAWMMGAGAIAAFTVVEAEINAQILTIALVFFVMAVPSAATWLFFGAWLKRIFTNARHLVIFNRVMAVVLLLSVAPVIKDLLLKHLF